jgi:hypothetical protein
VVDAFLTSQFVQVNPTPRLHGNHEHCSEGRFCRLSYAIFLTPELSLEDLTEVEEILRKPTLTLGDNIKMHIKQSYCQDVA